MSNTREPRPFQIKVSDELLVYKKNVILQAPPGAGKTDAAIMPFTHALRYRLDFPEFPRKCLYAVPMRVLANQFVVKYAHSLEPQNIRTPLKQQREGKAPLVDIQTGEQRRDPRLEAALTFATIDQLLSSFLGAPYSLSKGQANLNVGAVLSSYLVLDEFHLFDSDSTLPTSLEMLRMVNGICPFVLMTATFSTTMLHDLAKSLNAVVIGASADEMTEFAALPSQKKTRRYFARDTVMTAVAILKEHRKRSIVLCNQVERSQVIFDELRRAAPPGVEVWLLHSRFTAVDRKEMEAKIRLKFSNPNEANEPTKDVDPTGSVILVATQVIEVGLDITSEVVHTELSPANAIIQRAGRCARYEDEEGDVYVYRYALKDGSAIDLTEDVMPYASQKEVIQRTWEAFSGIQGKLDYPGELEVIDHAHGKADRGICEALASGRSQHRQDMFDVMTGGQRERASHLIREVTQQKIVIHANPKALLEQLNEKRVSPYSLEGFGLHFGTAAGYAREWLSRPLDPEPDFRVAMLTGQPDPEQNLRTVYEVISLKPGQEFQGAAIIFVHPDLAHYDPALGFDAHHGAPLVPAAELPLGENTDRPDEPHGYRLEAYEQHLERVYGQFRDPVWTEVEGAATRMERKYKLPEGSIHRAASLAVLLHDTGKLNARWQAWVKAWQKTIGLMADMQDGAAYAHTDNYTREHKAAERAFRDKRPPHAMEGAVAGLKILAEGLDGDMRLAKAAFTAIARHHTPDADDLQQTIQFEPNAIRRTQELLANYAPDLHIAEPLVSTREQRGVVAKDYLPYSGDESDYFLAMLLARVVRRADQRGTQMGIVKEED